MNLKSRVTKICTYRDNMSLITDCRSKVSTFLSWWQDKNSTFFLYNNKGMQTIYKVAPTFKMAFQVQIPLTRQFYGTSLNYEKVNCVKLFSIQYRKERFYWKDIWIWRKRMILRYLCKKLKQHACLSSDSVWFWCFCIEASFTF